MSEISTPHTCDGRGGVRLSPEAGGWHSVERKCLACMIEAMFDPLGDVVRGMFGSAKVNK
ncbi:MAG: hypothetical protein V4449_02605 [Patescibacteria group bacterium]